MRRLVVVRNGKAADAFLWHIQHYKHDFSSRVFGGGVPHRRPARYRDHGIDVRQEVLITAIDRHARLAEGSDGSRTTFDRLILATGGSGLIPQGLEAEVQQPIRKFKLLTSSRIAASERARALSA